MGEGTPPQYKFGEQSMEKLIDLFKAAPLRKEFKTKEFSFILRTLTSEELTSVLKRADLLSTSEDTKIFIAKQLTLAYSLESINGVEVLAIPEIAQMRAKEKDLDKVDLMMRVLGEFDAETISDLYACYNTVVVENNKKRESLKKDLVAQ